MEILIELILLVISFVAKASAYILFYVGTPVVIIFILYNLFKRDN